MRTPAQLQMMVWTLIAVLITGVGVLASVLQPPSSITRRLQAKHRAKTKIEVASDVPTDGASRDRAPASEVPQFSALSIDDKGSQAIDFALPCDGSGRFSRNVVQVRLTGSICGHKKAVIDTSEIRNMTNGFSATVFPMSKQDTFTTDYITLANGSNRIRILHFLKSGEKVEREFVIDRQ